MIAEMPDNVIPMNFHLYEIRIGDDSLEMEIDYIWNIFGISYSGNKKVMKQFEKISKDCISIMVLVKMILRKRQKDIYHW